MVSQKRLPSDANDELATWVSGKGHPTTPREIRTWRQEGWVAPAIVEPQGYARPTLTRNPPEAFDQALAVAGVRGGKRRSPHWVTLALFGRGYPVNIELLRSAYAKYFDNLQKALTKFTGDTADPFEAGEQLAVAVSRMANRTKQGRFMLRRAKALGESVTSIVASALTVVFTGMFGGSVKELSDPPSIDSKSAMDELHVVTGMDGFVQDHVRGAGSIVASHEELRSDNAGIFEHFTLEALEKASQSSTLKSLIEGREQAKVMLRFMTNFARSTAMSRGPATAFGLSFVATLDVDDEFVALMALLVTVLNAWMPGRMAAFLPLWEREADRHAALLIMLEEAPKPLRRYLGMNGPPLAAVPNDKQDLLHEFCDEFQERHPDVVERIINRVST